MGDCDLDGLDLAALMREAERQGYTRNGPAARIQRWSAGREQRLWNAGHGWAHADRDDNPVRHADEADALRWLLRAGGSRG